jgi:ornithine cyclodeaminase/alanine dehydrogenase-like protein (mu-crystallin family)
MNYSKLITALEKIFIDQEKFLFDKHTPEFKKDNKFLGDYFNQIAVEPKEDKPPRFYHTFSPFDIISNKAPHYAVVFENGERLLDIEFDKYVSIRTAAMNAVLLKAIGIHNIVNKKVLLFGSGKIATETVRILASELGLKEIKVITKSGDLTKITNTTTGVTIEPGNLDDISVSDIIICHTQSTEPVIPESYISKIKQGAILTSFISSTEHGEFPDNIYNSTQANIITDWDKTILGAKDLQRAKKAGLYKDIFYIKDLLTGRSIDNNKHCTVYRSTGTPIQNLAVLKELLENS